MNTQDFSTGNMFDDMFPDILKESFPSRHTYQNTETFYISSTKVFSPEMSSTNNSRSTIGTERNFSASVEDPWKAFINGTTSFENKNTKDFSDQEDTLFKDVPILEKENSEGYTSSNENTYNQSAKMLIISEKMKLLNNDFDINNHTMQKIFWSPQNELQTTTDSNFDSGIGDTDDSAICESEKTPSTPKSVVSDDKNKDNRNIIIGSCEKLRILEVDLIDSDKNSVSNRNMFDNDRFSNELKNSFKLLYNSQPPNEEIAIPVLQLPSAVGNTNEVKAMPIVSKHSKILTSTVQKVHKATFMRKEAILYEISKHTKEQMIAIFSNIFDQHKEALEASLNLFRQKPELSHASPCITETRRKVGRPKKYFTKLAKKEAKAKADARWYKKKMELRAQGNIAMIDL